MSGSSQNTSLTSPPLNKPRNTKLPLDLNLKDMSLNSDPWWEEMDWKELEKSRLSYQYRAEAGSSSAARSRACRRCGRGPGGIRNRGGRAAPTGTTGCTTQNRGLFQGPCVRDKIHRPTVGWGARQREIFGKDASNSRYYRMNAHDSSFLVSLL